MTDKHDDNENVQTTPHSEQSNLDEARRRAQWFNQGNMLTTAMALNSLLKEAADKMAKKYPADWYERSGIHLCQIGLMLSALLGWIFFDRVNKGADNTYGDLMFYVILMAWCLSVIVCMVPVVFFNRLPHLPRWTHEDAELDDETIELLRETAKATWLFGDDLSDHLKGIPMGGHRLYWSMHFTRLHVVRLRNGGRLRA